MMDSEWTGDAHTLIVRSVTPPCDSLDDGEMDYEISHAPTCKEEPCGPPGHQYMVWTCDVGVLAAEGLPSILQYSGTPVTEPGTYQIQAWGRKYYVWEYGAYEYDDGIVVISEDIP